MSDPVTDMAGALAKALASGTVVWLLVRSVDGAPPPVTALVIGLPMVLGAGFVAMAGTAEDAFLAASALRAAQSLLGTLCFVVAAGWAFERTGLAGTLATALAGWAGVTWLATASAEPWPLQVSLLAGGAAIALSHRLLPIRAGFVPAAGARQRRAAWPVAVQAGAMVIVLSAFAQAMGPRLSAVLAAAPVAMVFLTVGMKRSGTRNAAATYQSARLGIPCLYAYLAGLVLMIPHAGGLAAALLALLPSLALSALIVAGRLHLTSREFSS